MNPQDPNAGQAPEQRKIEFGYFAKRKDEFNKQLEGGFAAGFGAENMVAAPNDKPKAKKKPADKKPKAQSEVVGNETTLGKPASSAKKVNLADLPKPGTPASEWTDDQRAAFAAKMAKAKKAKKS